MRTNRLIAPALLCLSLTVVVELSAQAAEAQTPAQPQQWRGCGFCGRLGRPTSVCGQQRR
jgi:hypothetical protein